MKRVVVTGLGIVSSLGHTLTDFEEALRAGRSGIRFVPEQAERGFGCQVAGLPEIDDAPRARYFDELALRHLRSMGLLYGTMAGLDAGRDPGLPTAEKEETFWNYGCIFGSGCMGVEAMHHIMDLTDQHQVKRLGGRQVQQCMASAVSAELGGRLGLGNRVTANSSACSTGTEAVILGFEHLRSGRAQVMLCGSSDSEGAYMWAPFDAMRLLSRTSNDDPARASCPLSIHAKGFVPGGGSGALVLEELDHAQARGATIYGEILGGAVNAGGQRQGGTMFFPNPLGVQYCIQTALADAQVIPEAVDAISGHLTSTLADPQEVANWSAVLHRRGADFPYLNAPKSLLGHCLAAAGSVERPAIVMLAIAVADVAPPGGAVLRLDLQQVIDRLAPEADGLGRVEIADVLGDEGLPEIGRAHV